MTWTVVSDIDDSTAAGGTRRQRHGEFTLRHLADGRAQLVAYQHAGEASHELRSAMRFPGATFIYCECGATFHVGR